MNATLEKPKVEWAKTQLHMHVTLLEMPDEKTFALYVDDDKQYFVHFVNQDVFGVEFAILQPGYNLFTMVAVDEQTPCHVYTEAQLRSILAETAMTRTNPTPIPPRP